MLAFRARYVFPIDRPPLRDAVVAIDHDRIVAVGDASSPVIRDLLPGVRDLGEVAILPGLINPHTHLEFSDLDRPLGEAGMSFSDWIRLVVHWQRSKRSYLASGGVPQHRVADEESKKVLALGVAESQRRGVTALGDIESGFRSSNRAALWSKLMGSGASIEATDFLEAIALRSVSIKETGEYLDEAIEFRRAHWASEFRPGISPHSPYTVHPDLLRRCCELSTRHRIPLAHHLAESREELMLLRSGRGPFVKLLEDFDAWVPDAIPFGSRPLDYLRTLAGAHRALVIHGNYLDDKEIEFLAANAGNMSVVYCPRTHAYFQHDAYPLAKMLSAGVNVAIGTDSRASNPDLSVMDDLRFVVRQHPIVSPTALLRMITIDAARALGRDDEIGTLTPGKFADLAVFGLPAHDAADPHELLLDPRSHVVTTVFRGRAVYGEQNLFA